MSGVGNEKNIKLHKKLKMHDMVSKSFKSPHEFLLGIYNLISNLYVYDISENH